MQEGAVPQGDVIDVDLDPASMLSAYVSQRRRLAEEALTMDVHVLAAPSRCREWTVADVLRHLCDVDSWVERLWAGEAPPFDAFDPKVTPNEFVRAARSVPDLEVRDRYVTSTAATLGRIDPADRERWATPSVSPLGFVPWWQSALHLLWDSWLHERDALLPIGATVAIETAELTPVLFYGLAVAGTFCRAPVDIDVVGAHLSVREGRPRVTAGAAGITADEGAATIIDALAGRGSLEEALAGTDPHGAEQISGLASYLRS